MSLRFLLLDNVCMAKLCVQSHYLGIVSRITALTWEKVPINLVRELVFPKPWGYDKQPGNTVV